MAFNDILANTLAGLESLDKLKDEEKIAALVKLNIMCISLMDHIEEELMETRKLIIDLYNRKKI